MNTSERKSHQRRVIYIRSVIKKNSKRKRDICKDFDSSLSLSILICLARWNRIIIILGRGGEKLKLGHGERERVRERCMMTHMMRLGKPVSMPFPFGMIIP